MKAENFIAFFTVCGFFTGVVFSAVKLIDPIKILLFTFVIKFLFYLVIQLIIMNYIDVRLSFKKRFDKDQYEQTADYLIGELALREKRIDNILSKLASENILIKQALGKNGERNAKAA